MCLLLLAFVILFVFANDENLGKNSPTTKVVLSLSSSSLLGPGPQTDRETMQRYLDYMVLDPPRSSLHMQAPLLDPYAYRKVGTDTRWRLLLAGGTSDLLRLCAAAAEEAGLPGGALPQLPGGAEPDLPQGEELFGPGPAAPAGPGVPLPHLLAFLLLFLTVSASPQGVNSCTPPLLLLFLSVP